MLDDVWLLLTVAAFTVAFDVKDCTIERSSRDAFNRYQTVVFVQSTATLRLNCAPKEATEQVKWWSPEGSQPYQKTESREFIKLSAPIQLNQSGSYKCAIKQQLSTKKTDVLVCVYKANDTTCPLELGRFVTSHPRVVTVEIGAQTTLNVTFHYYGDSRYATADWSRSATVAEDGGTVLLPIEGDRYRTKLLRTDRLRNAWLAQLHIADTQLDDAGAFNVRLRLYGGNCSTTRTVTLQLHKATQIVMSQTFDNMTLVMLNETTRVQCNVSAYPAVTEVRWTWALCRQTPTNLWLCDAATDLPAEVEPQNDTTLLVSSVRLRPTGVGEIRCRAGDSGLVTKVLVRERNVKPPKKEANPVRVESFANVSLRCEANRNEYLHLYFERNGQVVLNGTYAGVTLRNSTTTKQLLFYLDVLGQSQDDLRQYQCVLQTLNMTTVYYIYDIKLEESSKMYWYVGGFLALLVLAFALSSLCCYCHGFSRGQQESGIAIFADGDMNIYDKELPLRKQGHLLPYNKKFEFPRGLLVISRVKLGAGEFGVVYKAQARGIVPDEPTTTVAAKSLKSGSSDAGVRSLIAELKIMAHIEPHRNVLRLLGAVTSGLRRRNLILITEYCELGNLRQVLLANQNRFVDQVNSLGDEILADVQPQQPEEPPSIHITTLDLVAWALQAATGMAHLAQMEVLHGDLAARNCLLTAERQLKIADFGMSRTLQPDADYKPDTEIPKPIKWMALESLCDGVFNTTTDVWSFGILMWEMFSLGAEPYRGIANAKMKDRLKLGHRMMRAPYATHALHDLMRECWMKRPPDRPCFPSIMQRLRAMMPEQDYELPTQCRSSAAPVEIGLSVPLFVAPQRPRSRPAGRRSETVLQSLDPIDLIEERRKCLRKATINEHKM